MNLVLKLSRPAGYSQEGPAPVQVAWRLVHGAENRRGPREKPALEVEAWPLLPRGARGAGQRAGDAAVYSRGASSHDAPVCPGGREVSA